MSATVSDLSVDEILDYVAAGAHHTLSPSLAVTQLDHALQTAALLAQRHPDDTELAVAGLVHDIGHLLPGGRDETHAADAAAAVRAALGERVAGIVGLHVEAKRYLVATEGDYGGVLSGDSVVSLDRQGGALAAGEVAAFEALPAGGRRRAAAAGRRPGKGGWARGPRRRPLGPCAAETGRRGHRRGQLTHR